MAKCNLPSTHRGHAMKPPSPPTPSGSVCFFQGPNQPYHPCLQLATCHAGPGRRRVLVQGKGAWEGFSHDEGGGGGECSHQLQTTLHAAPYSPYPTRNHPTRNYFIRRPQPYLYQPYPQPTLKPSLATSTSNDLSQQSQPYSPCPALHHTIKK